MMRMFDSRRPNILFFFSLGISFSMTYVLPEPLFAAQIPRTNGLLCIMLPISFVNQSMLLILKKASFSLKVDMVLKLLDLDP